MATVFHKCSAPIFHLRRVKAATRLHCRLRRPTTFAAAVASPPENAASSDAVIQLASSQSSVSGSSGPPTAPSAFLALGVDPMLAEALPSLDVTRPSPIQAAALPAVLSGANCAIQSYTGSGKTLSYLLPALTLALRRAERLAADPTTPRRGNVPDVPVQVLVVAPSQELAMQIVRVAKSLMPDNVRRYAVQQVIGGANPKRQAEALALVPGPLVVVGTPGRLADMIRSGSLRLHQCPLLVLDEADQLLASAFAEDINHISDHCGRRAPPRGGSEETLQQQRGEGGEQRGVEGRAVGEVGVGGGSAACLRQTVLVSATLTPRVLSRSARWCPDPRFVSAGAVPAVVAAAEGTPGAAGGGKEGEVNPAWGWGVRGWDGPASTFAARGRGSAGGVEGAELVPTMPPQLAHYFMVVEPRHKVDALRRAVHALGVQRALVFMNFQQRLQDAQFKLQARGMKAAALHGEMPRLARANLLNDFRRGRLRALVVSDVAARGLDVPSCDAVFHLELPSSAAHYAHRAGRTGRLSAALAAAAAAEAAEAAAVRPPATATAAAAAGLEDFFAQAAGTVITIVSPSERFVVDKLAAQLGVPLLEAHVSHGQLQLGPPPGGYSFDKDVESDRTEGEVGSSGRPIRRERRPAAAAAAAGRRGDGGAEASSSGRSAGGSQAAAEVQAQAAAATRSKPGLVTAVKADGKKQSTKDSDKYDVIVDDDDDIILDDDDEVDAEQYDYEILDEDLETFKRLRPAEVRHLGSLAIATGTASGAAAAAGIKLRGQRKQRVLPPGLEPGSGHGNRGGGGAAAGPGERALSAATAARAGRRREGPQGPGQGRVQVGSESRRSASSRSEVVRELHRELEELRAEKEQQKQQARVRGGGFGKSP